MIQNPQSRETHGKKEMTASNDDEEEGMREDEGGMPREIHK